MLQRALEDLDNELNAYRRLSGMLDEQFQMAKRMEAVELSKVSSAIAAEVSYLDERRRMRAQLLKVAMTLARQLPAANGQAPHEAVEMRCVELKKLALQCKASTLRNGQLLASQYEIMQRILHGEKHTYAPG